MAKTLQQVLDFIDTFLPNPLTTQNKIDLINDEIATLWKDMTSTSYYSFDTIAEQSLYTMPNDMNFEMIIEAGLMISNSTKAVSSTTVFNDYKYYGPSEEFRGNAFYDALDGVLGVYPIPDAIYPARIRYQPRATVYASSDTALTLDLSQDYIKLIQYKTMAMVAKAGNAPDIDLANNWTMDAEQVERDMKMDAAKKKRKMSRERISFREGWNC